jgi:hypothetical protein
MQCVINSTLGLQKIFIFVPATGGITVNETHKVQLAYLLNILTLAISIFTKYSHAYEYAY